MNCRMSDHLYFVRYPYVIGGLRIYCSICFYWLDIEVICQWNISHEHIIIRDNKINQNEKGKTKIDNFRQCHVTDFYVT